jgi:hypothetical protein
VDRPDNQVPVSTGPGATSKAEVNLTPPVAEAPQLERNLGPVVMVALVQDPGSADSRLPAVVMPSWKISRSPVATSSGIGVRSRCSSMWGC